MSKVGRMTKEVLGVSMKNAYEAGFAKALEVLSGDLDQEYTKTLEDVQKKCWEEWGKSGILDYDPRETKELVMTSSRGRGRPAGSKSPPKPEEGEHLASLPYDPEKCRGRFWNQGYGGQCWRNPLSGDDLCKGCAARRDNDDKDFWGYYDDPLGSDAEHTKSGKPHAWKKLQADRAEKKESDKKEKQAAKKKALKEKAAAKRAAAEAERAAAEAEKAAAEAEKAAAEASEKAAEEAENAAEEAEEEAEEAENVVAEAEKDEEDTQSLGGDDNEYKDEEPKKIFEEYECDGFVLKWNKETNILHDPDDDMRMGEMIFEDGKWVPKIDE
jgi:flagellar biosynthesis GTPase FlhF